MWFQEYEDGKTPEAKLVKDLDKFDMVLQAYEYEQREGKPRFLQAFFDSTKDTFIQSHPYVQSLVKKLREARESNLPFSQ
jgi:putative hydrolase of HD superfamily